MPWLLELRFTTNTGAGFGLFSGMTAILSIISVLFIALILINLRTVIKERYYWAVALVIAGALANLYDRIFYGFVIDFIELPFWPVFNIADSAITVGALGVGVYLLKDYLKKKHHSTHS